jgi:hypothetical protein
MPGTRGRAHLRRRRDPAWRHARTPSERPAAAGEEAMHGRGSEALAVLALQPFGDLDQRETQRLSHHPKGRGSDRLDPARPRVPALDARRNRTSVQPKPPPLHHGRSRDPKALRCSTATQAAINRGDHTLPAVEGKRLRHGGWLPSPAATLNHDPHSDGSPRAIARGSERLPPWPFPVKHRAERA